MADVEAKTAPDVQSLVSDKTNLASRLDELLEHYLYTLDAYQKAQQQLTKHLSSGYLSLAQANFTHNAHARYGRDYYDERMQASRKISISESEDKVAFSMNSFAPEEPRSKAEETSPPRDNASEPKDNNPVSDTDEMPDSQKTDNKTDTPQPAKESPPTDPIRWFGILVPPALRAAQTSFVSAVEGPILELSTLSKDLKQQEIEVGRIRKQIKKL